MMEKHARNERWPDILQNLLGQDHLIFEEGLNSRTTNIDYAVTLKFQFKENCLLGVCML
jgi:hypothetical protein